MQRQEKVYFPRKTRAPYFAATNSGHSHHRRSTDASAATLVVAAPLADATADAVTTGNTTSSANLHSASPWNEADAAAGGSTTVASALASPASTALRAIASVPRMPTRVSSSGMNNSSSAVTLSSRAAILPTFRRTSEARSSTSRQDVMNNNDNSTPSYQLHRGEQNNTSSDAGATTTLPSAIGSNIPVPDWRLRVRMRTVGVGLVLALNIGTDPPDTVKPHPCAVLQCWMDPRTVSRSKAKEWIGERLEQQYAVWQLARTARPLKYRRALDPTVEDVRNLCMQLRRQARNE